MWLSPNYTVTWIFWSRWCYKECLLPICKARVNVAFPKWMPNFRCQHILISSIVTLPSFPVSTADLSVEPGVATKRGWKGAGLNQALISTNGFLLSFQLIHLETLSCNEAWLKCAYTWPNPNYYQLLFFCHLSWSFWRHGVATKCGWKGTRLDHALITTNYSWSFWRI